MQDEPGRLDDRAMSIENFLLDHGHMDSFRLVSPLRIGQVGQSGPIERERQILFHLEANHRLGLRGIARRDIVLPQQSFVERKSQVDAMRFESGGAKGFTQSDARLSFRFERKMGSTHDLEFFATPATFDGGRPTLGQVESNETLRSSAHIDPPDSSVAKTGPR